MKQTKRKTLAYKQGYSAGEVSEYQNHYTPDTKRWADYKEGYKQGLEDKVECIQVTEHMSFNLGNALKYIWRCDLKKDAIEDLKKAKWYIERELALREKKEGLNS